MKLHFFIAFIFLSSFLIQGKKLNTGHPFITNYSETDNSVSSNNTFIAQDQRGIMYFANEFGILEFDGTEWNIIQVASNRSMITSLAIDNENRIYAGAQGDFGYLTYKKPYGLFFKSLVPKIPQDHINFGIIFNILLLDQKVIFHSREALFIYQNDTIQVLKTGNKIRGIFNVNGQIFVQDEEQLFLLKSDQLMPYSGGEVFKDFEIKFMIPFKKDGILVGTYQNGLYLFHDGIASPMKVSQFEDFNACKILNGHLRRNGNIAIGTSEHGVCIFNDEGLLVNQISTAQGLQNGDIRALYSDQNDNLWVANKKGIDFVQLASPFSRIIPDPEEPIGVYSATLFKDKLYFATHNGVLTADPTELKKTIKGNEKFDKLKGLPELTWSVNAIDSILIIAHDGGFSQIIENQLVPIYNDDGGWMVKELPNQPGWLVGGTYSGLVLFKYSDDKYEFVTKIEEFNESSRVIEIDNENHIWVAHGYKGIYKIKVADYLNGQATVSYYDDSKGLPTNIFNNVFRIWDEIIIGTENGFYSYDQTNDLMVLNKELSDLLGYQQGRNLTENPEGKVWFINGSETGILTKHAEGSYTIEKTPFYKLNNFYIPGFEFFYFPNEESVIIGAKNGAVVFDPERRLSSSHPMLTLLRKVELQPEEEIIYTDNLEFLCDTLINADYVFPYSKNSIQFTFTSTFYENTEDIRYKVFLQGFDTDWSEWKPELSKEYTNLHEGNYVFRVKSKNIYQTVSDESTFSFTILPPWYKTIWAYLSYFAVLSGLMFLFLKVNNTKAQKEKDRYIKEQTKIRELEQALFHEQSLEAELKTINQELAGIAMQVIYKNEKLSELKNKLSGIIDIASDKVAQKLNQLMNFIESEIEDDEWEDFELRFDQSHDNFIKNLKEEFPILTPHDLKICAYLKMNLSSKEIADLLNLSVRGVENARYRVRKRMGLESSVNLTNWLLMRK